MAIHMVIMAGGKGERLWPISREGKPKQLLSFDGKASLLRGTMERLLPLCTPETVYIATGRDIAGQVAAELPGLPAANILAEPFGRNTAPCIALAAAFIARKDPRGIMAVFPSDHIIAHDDAFRQSVAFGAQALADYPEYLLTIGIKPTHAETGYGYIAPEETMLSSAGLELLKVKAFREKPSRELAQEYISQGCLWNAGMFMWRVDTILALFADLMPGLHAQIRQLSASAFSADDILRFYEAAPSISIDYAIMEKAPHVGVIPADFGWNDIGSWDAVGALGAKDSQDNAITGAAFVHESADNVIWSTSKKIVLIGMHDCVVVEGPDAVLVCPRERSQEVSAVLKRMLA